MKYLTAILFGLFCLTTFAQSPTPPPAAVAVDSATAWLILKMAGIVFGGGFVVDMIARLWPTSKPQSVLMWISAMLVSISKLLTTVSSALDKIVQNVKA